MATTAHSVQTVCETIWQAERELALLDWQVQGVYAWQCLRFETYMRLAAAVGVFGAGAVPRRRGLEQARLALDLARGLVRRDPFTFTGRVDAIIVESARSTEVDGVRVCPYTGPLSRTLSARGQHLLLLEQGQGRPHVKTPDRRRRYCDGIELVAAGRMHLWPARLDRAASVRAQDLERFFLDRIGVHLAVAERVRGCLASFATARVLYRALLRRHRPRTVYCVCAYGSALAPMISAARELGIESVELQHGVISRYHMGYSYPVLPSAGRLAYGPDKLYAWGSPWDELMRADLAPELWNVVTYGFPHFEQRKARYAGVPKIAGRVLVLSQTVLTDRLAETVLAALPALGGREIVYKLHPGEYSSWHRHVSLVRLSQQSNVRIVTDADLYQLMAEAEVQVGVFSTALYEGLAFGCKTVLVPLPGCEYVQGLLERGLAISWDTFMRGHGGPG